MVQKELEPLKGVSLYKFLTRDWMGRSLLSRSLLLVISLGTSLTRLLLDDLLDDTDSDGLTHVTDGETSQRWVLVEGFNAHWLGWEQLDHGSITRLQVLWLLLGFLSGTSVDLGQELSELASNVSSVAIEDRGVTSVDLSRVVQHDDVSVYGFGFLWRIGLSSTSDVSTTDILD